MLKIINNNLSIYKFINRFLKFSFVLILQQVKSFADRVVAVADSYVAKVNTAVSFCICLLGKYSKYNSGSN